MPIERETIIERPANDTVVVDGGNHFGVMAPLSLQWSP